MKIARVHLKSLSVYSQSKAFTSERDQKELYKDYEIRCWRERCHVDKSGIVIIPPMQFSNSLKEAAKYLSISIPGKGKSTYTKHFESGVQVVTPLSTGHNIKDVNAECVYVPSDGRQGGTTRVHKYFPVITDWDGIVEYIILDDIITPEPFMQVLEASGSLIGIGRFRPRNRGYYGRFEVLGMDWVDK